MQQQARGGPPPSQQRGPPPPPPPLNGSPRPPPPPPGSSYGQPIPPSHPSHPQHLAWQQQQQRLAALEGQGVAPLHYQQHGQPPIRIVTSLPPPQQHAGHPQPNGMSASPHPSSAMSRPPPQSSTSPLPPPRPPLPPGYPPSGPPSAGPGGDIRQGAPPFRPPSLPLGPDGLPRPGPPSRAATLGNPRAELVLGAQLAASGVGPLTASATGVGPGLSKLTAFNEALSVASESDSLPALHHLVHNFFTETAVLKYGLYDTSAGLNKMFEIPIASFPRFHHIHLLSGCLTHTLSPSFIREFALHAPDPLTSRPIHVGHLLRADEAVWHSRFSDGVKVELTGTLTTHFVLVAPVVSPGGGGVGEGGGGAAAAQQAHGPPNLRIESMDFDARGHEEFVQREAIVSERVERVYDLPGFAGLGNLESDTMVEGGSEGSPTSAGGGKKGGSGAASFSGALTRRRSAVAEEGAGAGKEDPLRGHALPKSGGVWQKERLGGLASIEATKEFKAPSKVGSFGITEMGMRCLEIAESVGQLHELIGFSLETGLGPLQSLTRYCLPPPPASSSYPPTANPFPINPTSNAPIASTSQNPSTNPFYASSSVPPPPLPGSGVGVGVGEGRPPSAAGLGLPPSPSTGVAGGGKRKAPSGGGPPPRTPTPGLAQAQGDYEFGTGGARGAGSPNKAPRGGRGARSRGASGRG